LPLIPPSNRQINKRKERRKKKKKVITLNADQSQNISTISCGEKHSNVKEVTTQPPVHTYKAGVLKVREMETSETYSEYEDDFSSDEDDENLWNKSCPYNSSSAESDDENWISIVTPSSFKSFTSYSDDVYPTDDSHSFVSRDDTTGNIFSSDEDDDDGFLNGYFDATICHLFINDEPSSTEEKSDDESVYKINLFPQISSTWYAYKFVYYYYYIMHLCY